MKKPLVINALETEGCCVPKGWGDEIIIENNEMYCGKLLRFKQGAKFSMHYHMIKNETWYVQSGSFEFHYIDTENAKRVRNIIKTGDVVYIQKGLPHQLVAMEDNSVVFEVSTEHFDNDSYRIYRESHFDLK